MSESRTLARKRGSEGWRGKERVDSTVKEGRFRQKEKGKQRKSPKEKARASKWTQKLFRRIRSLGFTPGMAKFEMGKEVGKQKISLIK